MSNEFSIYVVDVESTGLSKEDHEIIELSILRLSDGEQKTWCLKPKKYDTITADALRINKHKIEDLKHQTEYGKQTYQDPSKVISAVEMWMLEDGVSSEDRVLCGQNIKFDCGMLEKLWAQEGYADTFPFGTRPFMQDTREIAIFLDIVNKTRSPYYNLSSLIKSRGIKNAKAHSAESDVQATKELFIAQVEYVRELMKNDK